MASVLLQAVPQAAIYAFPAAIAAGAYVNAKLGIGTDLKTWKTEKEWDARLGQRLQEFEGRCTLWGMLDAGNPEAEMLWFEGRTWTYGALKTEVNKFAKILQDNGVGNNDFVAVFTTNSPEMMVAILAISRLGGVAALINTNLRGDTFTHCMSVSNAKLIVSSPNLTPYVVVDGSFPHLSLNSGSFDTIPPFSSSPETPFPTAIQKIDLRSPSYTEITTLAPPKTPADLSVLIYTSGTTGRPKACAIRNLQIFVVANPHTSDLRSPHAGNLRTYSALPLFHGTGFFTGACYMLGTGGTLCLSRKFSASRFFKEVHESGATRILYIGELCRYLLASPPSKYDKDHKCVVAAGNGLRREIWEEFKERFNIPEIREFYRSTEGIAKFDNVGKGAWGAGRVGFAGPIRRRLETDTFLIRCDPDTGDPIRDPKTGLCIKCKLNEPGEAIGRVKDRKMITEYLGNEKATEEKLLHDVFKKGDCWQRMGDLLVMAEDGWVRFHDRIGDSFRWKGENVSAGEVRDLICELPNVQDAVVFGVRLSRYDGQAGGAVIVLKDSTAGEREVFMKGLYKRLREEKGLPTYAVPRLVRIAESIGTGVTFKQGKGDEAKKPWAPEAYKGGNESLYWLDGRKDQEVYRVLDGEAWGVIESGKAKL